VLWRQWCYPDAKLCIYVYLHVFTPKQDKLIPLLKVVNVNQNGKNNSYIAEDVLMCCVKPSKYGPESVRGSKVWCLLKCLYIRYCNCTILHVSCKVDFRRLSNTWCQSSEYTTHIFCWIISFLTYSMSSFVYKFEHIFICIWKIFSAIKQIMRALMPFYIDWGIH